MCGIAGFLEGEGSDCTTADKQELVRKMAYTLRHRGPDSNGIWTSGNVALGHARLIVVDPEGGAQPMQKSAEGATYAIVYNGELYNTEEVRAKLLKKGHTFASYSDTEVVLTAYMEWKEECVQHFNGIFAFAVWCDKDCSLFLARDRLGVKPLFYSFIDGTFIFGSEIKALLVHPLVKPQIDTEGLRIIFGQIGRTAGSLPFKWIKDLRPAHFIKVKDGQLDIKKYWQLKAKQHTDSLEETIDKVRELYVKAVERQLVSDVPLGSLLSGGIDSSSIAAIAARKRKEEGKGPFPTFSIEFKHQDEYFKPTFGRESNDTPYIKIMQKFSGTDHTFVTVSIDEQLQLLREVVQAKDLPGVGDVDTSMLLLFQEVKKKCTVVLSGECADEVFGGYPWFHSNSFLDKDEAPMSLVSIQAKHDLLRPEWRDKLNVTDIPKQVWHEITKDTPLLEGDDPENIKLQKMHYLNFNWFMYTLLERKDRLSMHYGVEVRVPFADHELMEYVWNIPKTMKTVNGVEKTILREALKGILPEEVRTRKKSMYPTSSDPALREKLAALIRKEILDNPDAPILKYYLKEKIEQFISATETTFEKSFLGTILQTNYWLQAYNIEYVE
jgi:asparagine synthase (glutamine-hydrolysing)